VSCIRSGRCRRGGGGRQPAYVQRAELRGGRETGEERDAYEHQGVPYRHTHARTHVHTHTYTHTHEDVP
jgi:hypothetical protein